MLDDITAASCGFNEDFLTDKQIKKLRKKERKHKHRDFKIYQGDASIKGFEPKTAKQEDLVHAIQENPQTIALGAAGTGKTFVTTCMGISYLRRKAVTQFIISKPNVTVGNSIGYFPGTLEEKMQPWVAPILSTIMSQVGHGAAEIMMKNKQIEVVPFEVLRGRSFEDAFVFLDEAQNCSLEELKLMVTRIGEGSKLVVSGDLAQRDIQNSGLQALIDIAWKAGINVPVIRFTSDDIVRSGVCKQWVKAFEDYC